MAYKKRRRKKKDYSKYYSDSRLDKYFAPIVPDIKEHFFSLSDEDLNELLLDYKEQYGDKSYEYALYAYPRWKNGYIKMSDQTLLRIVETLPYFLPEKVRLSLLEKLFNYFVNKTKPIRVTQVGTWQRYDIELNNLYVDICNQYATYYKPVDFKQEVLDLATWLSNDDMNIAKRILSSYFLNQYKIRVASIYADIERFKYLCRELKCKNLVYDEQILILKLPNVIVEFKLEPQKRSIFGWR